MDKSFIRYQQSIAKGGVRDALSKDIERRGCGVCCVASIVHTLTGQNIQPATLHKRIIADGGYIDAGVKHTALAAILGDFGLTALAEPCTRADIEKRILDYVFICSVTLRFPAEGSGRHLVLLHELDTGAASFMDPSRWGRDTGSISQDRFFASFSGRVISVCRN